MLTFKWLLMIHIVEWLNNKCIDFLSFYFEFKLSRDF